MSYTRIQQQDHHNTYYTEFVVDTIAEIAELPTMPPDCDIGSAAICLENSEVYMLNSNRRWVIL